MKTKVKPYPLIHPAPIVVVSTIVNDKVNFMTIGDIAVAGINPPLVMISIHAEHQSMKYINKRLPFGINIVESYYMKEIDYAGSFSSKNKDKSKLFQYEMMDGIPLIVDAPICLIIKEKERVQIEKRVILVCDVIETMIDDKLHENGRLNLTSIESLLYGLDNRYYGIGKVLGKGYESLNNNLSVRK